MTSSRVERTSEQPTAWAIHEAPRVAPVDRSDADCVAALDAILLRLGRAQVGGERAEASWGAVARDVGAVLDARRVELRILADEGGAFAGPGLEVLGVEVDAAQLVEGRPIWLGALPGRVDHARWRPLRDTLLVPCLGSRGLAAVIRIDGCVAAQSGSQRVLDACERIGLGIGAGLERERLATELEAARADRAHAARLELLGRRASAMAHDIANLITVILGYADLLELELADGGDAGRADSCTALRRAYPELGEIRQAADRAAALVDGVLDFARARPAPGEPVRVESVVAELEGMLRQVLGEGIDLHLDLDVDPGAHADHPFVRLDPGRLAPVLLNLASNARHALEGRSGPRRFSVATRVVRVGPQAAPDSATTVVDPPPGEYVRLSAEDNGRGFSRGLAERIFEPFFTTRAPGVGTGLGLAGVADFVRELGGGVRVASEPGAGARFDLYLPTTRTARRTAKTPPAPTRGDA